LYKGIDLSSIKTIEDLKKLPLVTKEDLITHNADIQVANFPKTFKASTSGSSGTSLVFNREELADSFNRASIFRGYSWYNVKPWQLNGYFWGFNFSRFKQLKFKVLDLLQNRFRLFGYQKKSFHRFVKKLRKASYLHGYSSMIYETAKQINNANLKQSFRLKMVKGTSEKIFDHYQQEVKKAFNCKIISEYGATEAGIIAFECTAGNMHINMEGVIVEEIDQEIVVTNLQMKSFPIIRYKLGDYIKLAPKDYQCSCGKAHLVLDEVTGRVGQNIYGFKNRYPSLYFYYIFKNLVKSFNLKLNYQVIQESKGVLAFKVEQHLEDKEEHLLKKEIYKYFKDDVDFTILTNQNLRSTNKKFKSFISKIN